MTDVYCQKRHCLNNRGGWCKAKAIAMDGVCRSYAPPDTLLRGKHARVRRERRKYKANNAHVVT